MGFAKRGVSWTGRSGYSKEIFGFFSSEKILLHHEHLRTRFAHFLSHGRLLASAQHQRHLEWKLLACGTDSSYQIAQTFIFSLVSSIYFPHQIRVSSSWIQAKRQVHDGFYSRRRVQGGKNSR